MKVRLSLLLLVALGAILPSYADWQRPVVNYSRNRYSSGSQNWMVAQHPNGWLYFANNKGLLEFDGEIWNTYSMGEDKTRALCIDRDSTIYIGGMRQFGYYVPNGLGGLDYHCLSDSLTRENKINVVWNIHATDNKVYFLTNWEIYCYYKQSDSLRVIRPQGNVKHSALIDGKLYMASSMGLQLLNGDRCQPLPGTQEIGDYAVVALLPVKSSEEGGNLLVVTQKNGLFLYDGQHLSRYRTAGDDFLSRNYLFCAAIHDETLALGSIQNGVLLVNLRSGRTESISMDRGIQNKTILSMAFDRTGDLWLGLDNGIDCIRLNSVRADLAGGKFMMGSGYVSCCYDGHIYYGTNQGVYRSDISVDPGANIRMERVGALGGQIWGLSVHDDKLFCASDAGLFLFSRAGIEQLPDIRGVWSVVSVNRPDRLIAGTYVGLFLLKKEQGRWRVSHRLSESVYSCKNLFVESGSVIWTSNAGNGIFRVTLSDDLDSIVEWKNYNNPLIPRDKGVFFSNIDNEVVLATPNGLFRYDQIDDALVPFEQLEQRLQGKAYYRYLRAAADGTIWYVIDETLYCVYQGRRRAFLRNAMIDGFEHINLLDDDHVIAGTEDGFVLLGEPRLLTATKSPSVCIRKVFVRERRDSLVYGRSYRYDDIPLKIPYSQNSLRIVCSTGSWSAPQNRLYSYRLKGSGDASWSEYDNNNTKEYTNLREGNYLFEVRGPEPDDGGVPNVASFAFRILPPWYRTPVMYAVYLCLVVGLFICLYYYVSRKQRAIMLKQQQELELEFKRESQQKDQEIKHLEEENIRAELRHKNEDLARATLNIVRKNEFLQKIQKEVRNISRAVREEDLVHIRRSTMRLIDNINTNLEHDNDVEEFEKAFDSIHHDFFRRLDENFPGLSKQEKMLCSYIKMGLISKEIAPILNISVRGVEISRYRLRKKLGLEEGVSLSDFLQKQ